MSALRCPLGLESFSMVSLWCLSSSLPALIPPLQSSWVSEVRLAAILSNNFAHDPERFFHPNLVGGGGE